MEGATEESLSHLATNNANVGHRQFAFRLTQATDALAVTHGDKKMTTVA